MPSLTSLVCIAVRFVLIFSAFVVCYTIFFPRFGCRFFIFFFFVPQQRSPPTTNTHYGWLDKSDFYRDYKTFNLFFYEQTYFPDYTINFMVDFTFGVFRAIRKTRTISGARATYSSLFAESKP